MLMELLTVMFIIAVLVVIAVPIYNSAQQGVRDRVDEANVRILNSATQQWIMADEGNDAMVESTASLKSKLSTYLSLWPESPNNKVYKLVNGSWIAE